VKLSPREEAAGRAYADDKGQLYLPGANLFAALIAAGVFHKIGRRQVTTRDTSLIPAGVTIEELVCPLGTDHFEVDSRSVVNQTTRGRIMCHRPRLDKWRVSFTLDVDTTVFDPRLVRAVLDDAGKKIGVGNFRPARKGPFGKFVVVAWDEAAEALPDAA
jgi:hypothetical protein